MEIKNLNETGVLWLINKVKTALGTKVDRQENKGLSENDFTTELKTKYDNAVSDVGTLKAAGGEPNAIATISVNGSNVAPDAGKNVNIPVPTTQAIKSQIEAYGYQNASDVETKITGKGYQTAAQVQSAISSALGGVTEVDIQVVTSLPATGEKGVIYLVRHTHTDQGDNFDEYVWVEAESKFEKIGNTDVDLSQYVKTSEIQEVTVSELETMWNS